MHIKFLFYRVFGFTVVFSKSPELTFSEGRRHLTMVTPVYIESENAIALAASYARSEDHFLLQKLSPPNFYMYIMGSDEL
jgi:hypothetical protein